MKYGPKYLISEAKSRPMLLASTLGVLAAIVLIILVLPNNETGPETALTNHREVELLNVSEYQKGALGLTAPTASGDSFVVRSEGSGKIVSVARPGPVTQGAVIASFDNSSERAALLQAEGVLDAARAAGAAGDIGANDAGAVLESAKQGAINASASAYTAFRNALLNTVDELFSNPRASVPGVRLSGGSATSLNNDRVALETELKEWERELETLSASQSEGTLNSHLGETIGRVDALLSMTNTFITMLSRQDASGGFTSEELTRLQAEFAGAASSLNATRASVDGARTTLTRAEEGVRSAAIGSTGGTVSVANAQIKQAQGSYMAALANYNKTIVRAPFSGVITAMNVQVGEILSYGADVAIITPDEGEETESSYVLPLSAVKYTPEGALVFTVNSENKLETKVVETGLVTASAITVTGLNGDERVVSDVRGLKASEEVRVK